MSAVLAYQGFDKSFDGKYAFVASFAFDGESRIITKEEVKPLEGFINLNEVVILTYKNQKRDAGKAEAISLPLPIPAATDSVLNITVIERKPEFPGGLQKFYEYLGKSIHYPTKAIRLGEQGKVFMSFVVEKDGSLTDIQVNRGVSKEIDAEGIRVMKESPKWYPGVQGGRSVRVRYNIAINFNLGKKG